MLNSINAYTVDVLLASYINHKGTRSTFLHVYKFEKLLHLLTKLRYLNTIAPKNRKKI